MVHGDQEMDEGNMEAEEEMMDDDMEANNGDQEGGDDRTKLDGQKYECDLSAYTLFHEGSTGTPCLSFDILKDAGGFNRDCETPVTCYYVAGTQAPRTHLNNIILMKMTNLRKTKETDNDEEEEEGDDDDDDEEEAEEEEGSDEPIVASAMFNHEGCVNRIRATVFNNVTLAASWSELGTVQIWDLSRLLDAVENPEEGEQVQKLNGRPMYTFNGHNIEGYAIDWAPTMPGTLATGDCGRNIHVWTPTGTGEWKVGSKPYASHTASVEDIQWSPNEPHVFASCSVDRSIKIWDCRAEPQKACMITASNTHESDVNVIHWNRNEPFIVSGGDDGKVQVWDLRQFKQNAEAVAVMKYHDKPVTTVEWHPTETSTLASGGEDHQILQWDLAVERDPDNKTDEDDPNIPPQLLFVHRGQHEIKELHWHPQVDGLIVSTALSGFNIFKTISC